MVVSVGTENAKKKRRVEREGEAYQDGVSRRRAGARADRKETLTTAIEETPPTDARIAARASRVTGVGEDSAPTTGYAIRVVEARTKIPADTLRVWERRYGFPKPARRIGGGRLYTEADIARLLRVARAIEAGYRPGDVIFLPDPEIEALAAARPPRAGALEPARVLPNADGISSLGPIAGGTGATIDRVIAALARDDVGTARRLLREATLALGPRGFVTEIAQPLATRMGEEWACGSLEVRHEHLGTALLTTQLRALLSAFDDDGAPVIVLATLPGELHLLGLDMIAVYVASRGASPRLLGGATPTDQLVATAQAMKAAVVGVSISASADRRQVREHVRRLVAALPKGTELWLGGQGARDVVVRGARPLTSFAAIDDALAALR